MVLCVRARLMSEEDLGEVIDGADHVENLLNQVIHDYSSPSENRHSFFWEVLLDSSVLPLGSKVKVASAIAHELEYKLDRDSLHKVIALRNAFAHHRRQSHPLITFGVAEDDHQVDFNLLTISNTGKVQRKKRTDAMVEFRACFRAAHETLVELINLIRSSNDT